MGTTETILGRWFKQNPALRERMVLATKVHEPMSDDINDRGLSARHIQMACEASLKRLGVEHIDLYQMHHIDRAAPVEEILQAMDRLISQGKVTYIGSSNFPGWMIARTNERASVLHRLGLVAEQGLYNLMERRAELEVLPACRAYGLGMIPWSPLAGGLLAGASMDGSSGRRGGLSEAVSRNKETLAAFAALCAELDEPPSAVALAWLLHQEGVTATIIGPGSAAQLQSVLHVPEIALSADVLTRLDEIFPPCGEAPEAYAW